MKIRTRLSLWYLSATLAVVLIFSLGVYVTMRHLLFRALERECEVIITVIENSYDPATKTFQNLESKQLFINEHMDHSHVIVLDPFERIVYRSPFAHRLNLAVPLARQRLIRTTVLRHPANQMPVLRTSANRDVRFHAVSKQIHYDDEHIGWVNIAKPLGDIEEAMTHLLWVLASAIVLVGLFVGGGSYFLARSALQPVTAIARKARRITSARLSERIEIKNPHDEIGQLAVVLNDSLERLQQAFESQRQFAADAAHELKTPVAILRSHWEDELNNPDLPDEFKRKLVADIETIMRLSRVINNLLLLSHAEGLRAESVFVPLRLDELLDDVIGDTSVLADMKSQTIRRGIIQPVTVHGDRDRLYQLVFNLVDNAVKYTPELGTITLSLEARGKHVVLRVEDTGKGIPKTDLTHIFDRFYRVDKDRSLRTGGSGLGLSICKMIAELHGGSIDAASTPGEGSVFTVRFPTP